MSAEPFRYVLSTGTSATSACNRSRELQFSKLAAENGSSAWSGDGCVPDYDQPFALRDNPFSPGPWIGGASPEFGSTDDLWTKPLRIHRVPRLETLFVAEAGPFKEYVERFDEVMDSKWFSKEQPSAPQVTLKFLIRGPVGAGKTTFANYLISQLSQYKLPPDKEWATVDYRSVAEFETMDSLKRIKAIADVFSKKVQQANYGALI